MSISDPYTVIVFYMESVLFKGNLEIGGSEK